jgi:hypothetical protein
MAGNDEYSSMGRTNESTTQDPCDGLPRVLPHIELRLGQVVWVMTELGFRGGVTQSMFYEYVKGLRKFGIPFERGGKVRGAGGHANYSYYHLMELALALTLRVYHVVPDSVLKEMIRHRRSLYRAYRRAYVQRREGMGAPVVVETTGCPAIHLRGVFLDLQIDFSGGRLVRFGPPKSLSPFAAMATFAERDLAARALLPINVSDLSERIIALSLRAPLIGRRRR